MDQKKTGHFIAELRKAEGLTQKELAGKLQITDKAVSKWECGNSMPDYAVMVRLCDVLGVSVNELLSGERLSSVEYNKKAEENIMTLMEERSETEKNTKKQRGAESFCGIMLIALAAFVLVGSTRANGMRVSYFIDFLSISLDLLFLLILLTAAKQRRMFFHMFWLLVHKSEDEAEIRRAKETADFSGKALLLSGGIVAVIYLVNWMSRMDNAAYFGPNLAHIVLGMFYSLIGAALLLVVKERL